MEPSERRVAIVLAASKGLGLGSALALAQSGFDLVVCSRSKDSLREAAEQMKSHGVRVESVVADVSKSEEIRRVFERAEAVYGRIDALVSNAGGPPPGAFLQTDDDAWRTAFELTLMSAIRSMRLAVQAMIPRGYGRIVLIGSSSVKQPVEGLVLSNAFRPALVGAMKTLSQEVARNGITVNIVSPGRIDTARVKSLDTARAEALNMPYDEVRKRAEAAIPVGRYGRSEELGALVAFLCSDIAGYITGQSIIVDGGLLSALP